MVTKGVKAKKGTKKAKALQQEYNELNQVHFKPHNDLKTLQTDFDWLTKDYGKMEQEQSKKVNIDMENCTYELWVYIQ